RQTRRWPADVRVQMLIELRTKAAEVPDDPAIGSDHELRRLNPRARLIVGHTHHGPDSAEHDHRRKRPTTRPRKMCPRLCAPRPTQVRHATAHTDRSELVLTCFAVTR